MRKALYLPTLTAIRFNPILRGFFERLVAAGKPKMQAVGACMRKLVMICYGVLKNRSPFDPNWSKRTRCKHAIWLGHGPPRRRPRRDSADHRRPAQQLR